MSTTIRSRCLHRRQFLQLTATAGGVAATLGSVPATASPSAGQQPEGPSQLIDVNVYLSRWPLRRLPLDDTPALVAKLRQQGVTQAWAGTFDGVLHKDVAAANARLVDQCRRHGQGLLVPFGTVNPALPDWEEDFRRCVDQYKMPGIRLHPNYHGYSPGDPRCVRLLQMAADRGRIVQVVLIAEDERMMHPQLRVEPTDHAPLADLARRFARLRLVLLNVQRVLRGPALAKMTSEANVFVDIAYQEGAGGLEKLLGVVPQQQVLFGSYAPMFYFEAAMLKLKESPLSTEQLAAVRYENAQRLVSNVPLG